jgi:hypothetical protein
MKTNVSVSLLLLLLAASMLPAQFSVRGGLQTWVYTWSQPDQDRNVDFYQGVQLDLRHQQYRQLGLRTYLEFNYIQQREDLGIRAYNIYATWRDDSRAWQINLGRQFLFNGVINGTIDGINITYRPSSDWRFRVVGGIEAPFDRGWMLQNFENHNAFGAYAAYTPGPLINADLSYFQRQNSGGLTWQQAGTRLYGELLDNLHYQGVYDHNLLSGNYQGMRLRFLYLISDFGFTVEYNDQMPRVFEDSFFRIFELEAYSQARTQVTYDFARYQFAVQFLYTMYAEDADDQQVVVSVSGPYGTIGGVFQDGYGGENIGAFGDVRYNLTPELLLRAYASVYNYRRYAVQISQDAIAYSLGATYRFLPNLALRLEGQQASNGYYSQDWRGMLFLNYGF